MSKSVPAVDDGGQSAVEPQVIVFAQRGVVVELSGMDVFVEEWDLDFREHVRVRQAIRSLDAPDGLSDVGVGATSQIDGFDPGLLSHELAEDGACRSTIAVCDDDDVLWLEFLSSDVSPVAVTGDVDSSRVEGRQNVRQIPANNWCVGVGLWSKILWSYFLLPRAEVVAFSIDIGAVVERRRHNASGGIVELLA